MTRRNSNNFFRTIFTAAVVCGIGIGAYLLVKGRVTGDPAAIGNNNPGQVFNIGGAEDPEQFNQRYRDVCGEIYSIADAYKTQYNTTRDKLEIKNIVIKSKQLFASSIAKKIIPFWVGTKVSKKGYTLNPRQGSIGSREFVLGVLADAGLKIKPKKWLRFNEANIIGNLVTSKNNRKIYPNGNLSSIVSFLRKHDTGLYLLYANTGEFGFIHFENETFNFVYAKKGAVVVCEPLNESAVFARNKKFFIGKLSGDSKLVGDWVLNRTVLKNH